MKNEKTIETLNKLIEINNDRIEGYSTASKETEEDDLKKLFDYYINTSERCHEALATEIRKMGGIPTEETKTTGKFFRVWMDVKAAITGKDRKAILSSCEYGEDVALRTYDEVLQEQMENLTPEQQALVTEQRLLIKADHDQVRALRDALIEQD